MEYAYLDVEKNIINQSISWNSPCSANGEIELFEVTLEGHYILNSSFLDNKTILVNATKDESYNITIELMPAFSYKIWIRANGVNETGRFFDFEFTTDDNCKYNNVRTFKSSHDSLK